MSKLVQKPNLRPISDKPLIPEKYADIVYGVLIFLAVFVFFGSAIFGHGFAAADNMSSMSFDTFMAQAKKSGDFPLWIPYIFGGMPCYGALMTTGDRMWVVAPELFYGFMRIFGNIFSSDAARMALSYVIYGLGMYALMREKKQERFSAFFVAIAAVFSTSVIIWPMIGHNTKPMVLMMYPYIFLLMEKLHSRFSLFFSALLIFAIQIMIEASHIQLIFYAICAFGVYALFELISRAVTKRDPLKVLATIGVMLVAGLMTYFMAADRYFSVKEYTPYSTRGSAPLVNKNGVQQDASGGNDYNYATMWSFSPSEITTFLNPGIYGFGKAEYKGPETNGQSVPFMSYWGPKTSEDAPPYMGILVLWLGVLGFVVNRKDPFIQSMMAIGIFGLLISFGNNFPLFYDLLFNNVPNFNKFRAPSMSLVLLQFVMPIMAGYGLTAIFKWRKEQDSKNDKALKIFVISSALFLVAGFIFAATFENSYSISIEGSRVYKQYSQQAPEYADVLKKAAWGLATTDWYVGGSLLLAGALLIYAFAKGKINQATFAIGIAAVLFIDLWRVGYRPLELEKDNAKTTSFRNWDYYEFIKKDNSKFRIADFVQQANTPAYYLIESVNGYHAAKLRVIQDLLDVADQGSTSVVTNPFLWNLMNVKYLVVDRPFPGMTPVFKSEEATAMVYENPQRLERVQFVDSVQTADKMQILQHLKAGDFNPAKLAFVEKNLPTAIEPVKEGATAKVVEYGNHAIKIEANATGNNLLYVSEIYYPPSWKAYIDGKETEIFKTNFAFRSVVVPAGKHTIEFKFVSEGFERGRAISMTLNGLALLVLVVGFVLDRKKIFSKKEDIDEVVETKDEN